MREGERKVVVDLARDGRATLTSEHAAPVQSLPSSELRQVAGLVLQGVRLEVPSSK